MKCNIDKTGRVLRLMTGLVLAGGGVAMVLFNLPGNGGGWRAFQVAMVGAGVFVLFEAIAGWCALRALGIKTRW